MCFYCRPTSIEVINHCLFWMPNKQLSFFLDISDRVEKEPPSSPIVQQMECSAETVVGNDWREKLTEDLRAGLYICI